jgi:N-acetylneuraminic acid mutarotase
VARSHALWDGLFIVAGAGTDAEAGSESPVPRVCHAAVVIGEDMWIHGGDVGDPYGGVIRGTRSDIWQYNLRDGTWRCVREATEHKLTEHTAVAHPDGRLILYFGGNRGSGSTHGTFSRDVLCLDTTSGELAVVEPSTQERPAGRSAHSAVGYEGRMLVFGGWNAKGTFNDLWEYDIAARAWRKLVCRGDVPTPRRMHRAAVSGCHMYVYGGYCEGNEPASFCDIYRVHLQSRVWERIRATGDVPSGRARATLVADPCRPLLHMIGGWNRRDHHADMHSFSTETFRWRVVPTNLGTLVGGIAQHSCIVHRRWLVVFGGYHASKGGLSSQILRTTIAIEDPHNDGAIQELTTAVAAARLDPK